MVIVVGTTPDYILKIHEKRPDDVAFVVNKNFLSDPLLKTVSDSSLIFTSFDNFNDIALSVDGYLAEYSIRPAGIACFDCESLVYASKLGLHLKIPFPELLAVEKTRNKSWLRKTINASGPHKIGAIVATGLGEIIDFFYSVKKPVVLKPLSGSGSELVFYCDDEEKIRQAVKTMEEQLPKRRSNPLFKAISGADSTTESVDPCRQWLAEEFISGPEYSCDFVFHEGEVTIIRSTGKTAAADQSFGSVLAYTFPAVYPQGFSSERLCNIFKEAAASLGFSRGHFMADFVIKDGYPFILEMTPRPGGDSIPSLVEEATGVDLLSLHIDISSQNYLPPKDIPIPAGSFASVNLFAKKAGTITELDISQILAQPWVRSVRLKKNVGGRLSLPPDDYDNRMIAHCIVSCNRQGELISIYHHLNQLLQVTVAD